MLPRPSTVISLQPIGEMWLRSAGRTRDPSGSIRDQLRAGDEQASVREPVRGPTESVRAFSDHLAVAVEVYGDDLSRSPVREPQPAVVPARGLGHGQAVEQYARLHAPSFGALPRRTRQTAKTHWLKLIQRIAAVLVSVHGCCCICPIAIVATSASPAEPSALPAEAEQRLERDSLECAITRGRWTRRGSSTRGRASPRERALEGIPLEELLGLGGER